MDEIDLRKSIDLLGIFEGMGINNIDDMKRLSINLFGNDSNSDNIHGLSLIHK